MSESKSLNLRLFRADELQEHMRVALLDPRWREQRDRALEEKKRHEDPYAPGQGFIWRVFVGMYL